jgi:hypothetical protein
VLSPIEPTFWVEEEGSSPGHK